MTIKDSGERRAFDSGAVRDIQDGKGRCDLLPLDAVSSLIREYPICDKGDALSFIDKYIREGSPDNLLKAVKQFCKDRNLDICTALLEVSKHYEEGVKKYSERNWEKGIPLHCYIDSGVRHYLKVLRGDSDEPHDRAFIWNMLSAFWTHCHREDLIDLPFVVKEEVRCEKSNLL